MFRVLRYVRKCVGIAIAMLVLPIAAALVVTGWTGLMLVWVSDALGRAIETVFTHCLESLSAIALASLLLLGGTTGCLNAYTRFPATSNEIDTTYQSTKSMAAVTIVAAFPQSMTSAGEADAFMWENLISIPFLGLPCMVDTICEFALDTVLFPVDWILSAAREGDSK